MLFVLKNTWALLFGMLLLMIGNGIQGTLLGVRGAQQGFTAEEMAFVMAGYFLGFLGGSRMAPEMIRRVGHVRVFAALASIISAMFILYAALPHVWAWAVMRVVVGFCISGVYVVAESWVNDSVDNSKRGEAMSLYMIVNMAGIVMAQGLLNIPDASGYLLFILISVLVSLSFAPILLSISPAPVFDTTKPMRLVELYRVSPLGCIGSFFLGGVFAALFGMGGVYGTERGLTVSELAIFFSAIYVGGLVLQYPIGYISDRMDRRLLILMVTGLGAFTAFLAAGFSDPTVLTICAFVIGGMANPLYSLLLAHTNDFLEHEDMAAASGALVFLSGLGAVSGPIVVGYAMSAAGPEAYFVFIFLMLGAISAYAAFRTTQRAATPVDETGPYIAVGPQATAVAVEVAQELSIEAQIEAEEAAQSEEEDAARTEDA